MTPLQRAIHTALIDLKATSRETAVPVKEMNNRTRHFYGHFVNDGDIERRTRRDGLDPGMPEVKAERGMRWLENEHALSLVNDVTSVTKSDTRCCKLQQVKVGEQVTLTLEG